MEKKASIFRHNLRIINFYSVSLYATFSKLTRTPYSSVPARDVKKTNLFLAVVEMGCEMRGRRPDNTFAKNDNMILYFNVIVFVIQLAASLNTDYILWNSWLQFRRIIARIFLVTALHAI